MTGFNHGLTGATIALTVKIPLLAVPLSFASHFLQDMIPHFGMSKDKLFGRAFNAFLLFDFLLSLSLMVVFKFWFPDHFVLIWACMIAAAAPDLMWAYYKLYIEHIKKKTVKHDRLAVFHQKIQWSQTPKGLSIEFGWLLMMIALLVKLK